MGKFWLLLISISTFHVLGIRALPPPNDERSNSYTVQELMARLDRLEDHRGRDALLSTSMRDEIARLNRKNQEYEARLNQLESKEKQLPLHSSSDNEVKQSKAMPTNCQDIRAAGNTVSGFYTVKGSTGKTLETIYCDYSFTPGAPGYETRIGYNDIKTAPVYFYAQRNTALATSNVISFDRAQLNIGGAMNLATGVFTAPRPGTYTFSFTALHADDTAANKYFDVELQLNGVSVGTARNYIEGTSRDDLPATLHSTLQLKANDQIRLYLKDGLLADNTSDHDTHFVGMLVEEELPL